MVFVHGSRLYGKVDQVPGLFYVTTMFFHVQFIPVIPYQSLLMLDAPKAAGQGRGIRIRLSAKSIFFTWLRTICLLAGILLTGSALLYLSELLQGRPGRQYQLLTVAAGLALAHFLGFW